MTSKSIFVATLTAFVATVGLGGAAHADPPTQVTYELTGSSPVADYISYQTDTGVVGQVQQTHVPLPWKGQFSFVGNPVAVISAQSPGSITCTIKIDGKVVNQATANGAPARTVCSN
ncbi:MmpS family transport accessory protein [Candidatus Mycobacterium wuenschmannii]|uniref:MmpS family transport accessory protein n=1 Tax=Candidatus Mycobacterium wuenschmannii TaxID=3027808 RepID=A0ABY8W2R4_9MYCO|nr:MmpS family transport accessory protein [Candidatus Mycobacterium wuenschmannii]WIM89294.1 MmpS family transport accessory protein [Candidatus Mycobacterium wuenschmannii]